MGGPQHIKAKFGKGFQIVVKLDLQPSLESARKEREGKSEEEVRRGMVEGLKATVCSKFTSCSVTDEHLDYLHFHVGDPSTPWGELFRNMESIKAGNAMVQDYSVSETTLEQIFLGFARGENEGSMTQLTVL